VGCVRMTLPPLLFLTSTLAQKRKGRQWLFVMALCPPLFLNGTLAQKQKRSSGHFNRCSLPLLFSTSTQTLKQNGQTQSVLFQMTRFPLLFLTAHAITPSPLLFLTVKHNQQKQQEEQ
jgi:hypothetical protein